MEKLWKLQKELDFYKKVMVAFSGGVDSALLLSVAREVLGKENVLAVTAKGIMISDSNYRQAVAFAKMQDISCLTVEIDNFDLPDFVKNRENRCYSCKKKIFQEVLKKGKEYGFLVCLEGSNIDDDTCYRPGKKAMEELGVISPLRNCGFTKKEIRHVAKELGLPVWNKPSDSCLATRFPYNMTLTKELFQKVEKAENYIKDLGIENCRVRVHGEMARIEIEQKEFNIFMSLSSEAARCIKLLKELGFQYITLDLEGFRSGSFDGN